MTGTERYVRSRRIWHFALAATVVVGALGALAAPATAGSLSEAAGQLARAIEHEHIPPPQIPRSTLNDFTHVAASRYGTQDRSIIATLDAAKSNEVAAIDSTATSVAQSTDEQTGERVRECAKKALSKVAQDYAAAVTSRSGYPDLHQVVHDAVNECLTGALPGVPGFVISQLTDAVTGVSDRAVGSALGSNPPAPVFGDWLQAAADDVQSTPSPGPSPTPDVTTSDTSASDTGGGGSSAPLVLVGLAVVGAVVLVLYLRRKKAG